MHPDDLVERMIMPNLQPNSLSNLVNNLPHRYSQAIKKEEMDRLWASQAALAQIQTQARAKADASLKEQKAIDAFKKAYIKVRTDNVVLDHQSAIELNKMILADVLN